MHNYSAPSSSHVATATFDYDGQEGDLSFKVIQMFMYVQYLKLSVIILLKSADTPRPRTVATHGFC